MKKNKMLRTASVLLILVLLTTSIIGGTFAKYTTTGTGTDSARVAKWGVVVNSEGNAFATEYAKDDGTITTITGSVVEALPAAGAAADKLVAPGTTGNLLEASISGKPEVAVKVTTSAELTLTGWEIPAGVPDAAAGAYCPIVITVDGTAYKMGAAADPDNHVYATTAEFENAVEKALVKDTATFEPNTDLATGYSHTVTWNWPIAGTGANPYQTDAKDTALGDVAAKSTAPRIEFTYTAIVTQID